MSDFMSGLMFHESMNKKYLIILTLLSGIFLTACDSGSSSSGEDVSSSDLIGSWYYSENESAAPEEQVHIVLTFLDENAYVIANDEADEDTAGSDGFEIGTYTLSETGVFEAKALVDTNGEWGFSHPCSGEIFQFEMDDNILKLTADGEVGEGCSGGGANDVIELNRVSSSEVPLIGSWLLDIDLEKNEFALVTFLDNGSYMHVENKTSDEAGEPGIERGELEFTGESGEVQFTALTDTNNQWGFSHPCGIRGSNSVGDVNCGIDNAPVVQTLEVDGDTLTYINGADTITNGEVEDPVDLQRVK